MQILIILLAAAYFTDVFQIFEISDYGVTMIDFVLLAIFLLFIKRIIWDGEEMKFTIHPGVFFLIALILAAIVSGITPLIKGSSPQILQFLKTSIHFIFLVFFTVVCSFYRIETKTWTNFVKFWLIISIFINIFGIYQIFARAYELPLAWIQFTNISLTGRSSNDIESIQQLSLHWGLFYRATSIFTEPSALASFNVMIQIFLIVPFIQKAKPFFRSKALNITTFTFSIIALFLCFSMTGFVGMALVIAGIFVFHWSKRLIPFIAGFVATIIIIFATDSFIESYAGVSVVDLFSDRLSGIMQKSQVTAGETIGVRLHSGRVGIEIWEKHVITGTGLGLTAYNNREEVEFGDFSSIAALAEMGLLGFIVFVGLFVSLFIITGRFLLRMRFWERFPDELKRWTGLLFFLMLHQFLINYISGNNLIKFALWLSMGIIFSVINQVYMETGKKIYVLRLVKKPLKKTLSHSISRYINQMRNYEF